MMKLEKQTDVRPAEPALVSLRTTAAQVRISMVRWCGAKYPAEPVENSTQQSKRIRADYQSAYRERKRLAKAAVAESNHETETNPTP